MKVNFDNESMLTFEVDSEEEKVYALLGTKFGDGENFVILATEDELEEYGYNAEDWAEDWDKDVKTLEVGETATHGYWFYDKANVIVRLA